MNLVFMSDTLTPERKKDINFLPHNSHPSHQFFEYTRIDNPIFKDKRWDDVNVVEELPKTKKYVIVYDTFGPTATIENLINRDTLVSNKILSDLKESKCSIVFFHTDLNWRRYTNQYWEEFYTAVEGIDLKRFYFLFDEQVIDDEIKNIDLKFNVFTERSWPSVFLLKSDDWTKNSRGHEPSFLTTLLNNTKGYYRQFKYCSHNNNLKDHRVELLLFLIKNNLLDDGVWSWFGGNEPIEQGAKTIDFTKFDSSEFGGSFDYSEVYGKEAVDTAHKLVPYTYDYKVDGLQDYLNIIPHFNSYFNIVTESVWGPGYENQKEEGIYPEKIHITEKIWKCIITFQPFVLISNKHNLKKLQEWGFKTFHPFIDESYDELDTYKERKILLEKEIKRLCSMTREELDTWYWSMEDILIHNQQHYVEFMKYQFKGVTEFIFKAYND
tara:strand:+ start:829 stop:2142 length:1314 start_codon:yes stop_codon:yes gene_type:complete